MHFFKILASERFKTEEPTSGMDLHAMSFHATGKGQKNAQGDSHLCICLRERDRRVREVKKLTELKLAFY